MSDPKNVDEREPEGASGSLNKLPDDELEGASGGRGIVEYTGEGDIYRISYECEACGNTQELAVLSNSLMARVPGVFVCSNCGRTRNYEIAPNGPDSGYYIRSWRP